MRQYILSGFTDEYSPNFDEQLQGAKALGLSHIELRFADGINVADLSVSQTAKIKAKLSDAQIAVSAIGSPLGKIHLADDFTAHMEQARRTFYTANVLEASYIRMFSFYLPEGKTRAECREEVLDKLAQLLNLADQFGVTLCHENEARIYGESPEMCLDILRHFDGRLKAVFDMGNFRLDDYDPLAAYELLKEYIAYFHIKDATPDKVIVPPGTGDAKIPDILRRHRAEGCGEMFVSLEPHLTAFVGLSNLTASTLKQSYAYESSQAAFTDSATRLNAILAE